MKKMIEVFKQK
jgi:UDP-N-acetylglucosamine 2-epimerase